MTNTSLGGIGFGIGYVAEQTLPVNDWQTFVLAMLPLVFGFVRDIVNSPERKARRQAKKDLRILEREERKRLKQLQNSKL